MFNFTDDTDTTTVSPNGVGALPFTPLQEPAVIFAVIFSVLLFLELLVAARFWRYYGHATGMLCGLLLELLGYVAKAMLSHDRMNKNGYIMYIIGLTLGPTFLSSSLYLSISALLRRFPGSRQTQRCCQSMGPRTFSTIFILGDFICLSFIGVGGSLAAIYADRPIGVDLMIAGLGTQILFTSIFCIVLAYIGRRIVYRERGIGRYIALLGFAGVCLFVRSCWRAAELSGGFNGPLASKEGIFIALDSVPMVIMSILLLVLHPGFWLGGLRRPTTARKPWGV